MSHTTPSEDAPATEEILQPFAWLDASLDHVPIQARPLNRLIGQVMDVADGVRVILEAEQRDELAMSDEEPPLFSALHRSALRRLGLASLQLLSQEASRLGEWIEGQAREPGSTS
jgi:hypothetical protein